MISEDVFSTLCLVRADLSPLTASAQPKTGKSGKQFWTIVFSIEIHFGLTEFRARIKWVDTTVRKTLDFDLTQVNSCQPSELLGSD